MIVLSALINCISKIIIFNKISVPNGDCQQMCETDNAFRIARPQQRSVIRKLNTCTAMDSSHVQVMLVLSGGCN